MTFNFQITESSGHQKMIDLQVGQSIFILGANGTGKSSLMQRLYSLNMGKARRIAAHRQTWFTSNAINFSAAQKRQTENNILSNDNSTESRWRDHQAEQRANMAIYDLIDADNIRNRNIAMAVDNDNLELARTLSKADAPIKIINELLRLSNIPIEISVIINEQVLASKSGCTPYSVAELSDGERNALLIAATVLTVPSGTLLLIDEPERHLHRSIISPLLTLLFAKRADCAFVVSTHEVMLPLDNPSAQTILIRSCSYNGSSVASWDADLIPASATTQEDLMRDILGARRKVLFIEGNEQSLDLPLYSLVFSGVSVIAKSSCRDVDHAVSGIRDSNDLHWLRAFGIIDHDRRADDEVSRLKAKGIYALPIYAVESIYYHIEIQKKIAFRHAAVTGFDPDAALVSAREAALEAIQPHVQRFSTRAVEKHLQNEFDKKRPKQADIAAGEPINITIEVKAKVDQETSELNEAIRNKDLGLIISRYPVRESPALKQIALKLGFQSRDQYEGAVRQLLMQDSTALEFVKTLFDTLPSDLSMK